MNQTPSDILALTNEAAVLFRAGRAVFANASARRLLGEDCVGQSMRKLLGADVAGAQASSFVAEIPLGGRSCTVRVSKTEEGQIVFLSCPELAPAIVNDPFLCELRSGLMNIGLSADSLRTEADRLGSDALLEDLRSLTRSYYRLIRLIENASLVLNAARGGQPLALMNFNLSALCRSILDITRHFRPDYPFQVDLEEDICLTADPALVKILLLNLIANCLTHAGEGCRVSLRLSASPGSVVLAVSDDGAGIPPEQLHTVFDRYRYSFQVGDMNRGPGLGLTVARIITMAHGGTLLLESRPGRGTTVRASFSRELKAPARLRTPQPVEDTLVRDVLAGLSGCLPPDCYTEKYMD